MQTIKFPTIIALTIILSACGTRQISDSISGSTAQRLVTYSLERFVTGLLEQPEFSLLDNETVHLNLHFVRDHPLLDYANELLSYHLKTQRSAEAATSGDPHRYEINVFFNSIGTDHDSIGLSVPTFGLASTPDSRLSVLSIDRFHGVTEGYATILDTQQDSVVRTKRILSRVRTDNVATPVLDFPINQLD